MNGAPAGVKVMSGPPTPTEAGVSAAHIVIKGLASTNADCGYSYSAMFEVDLKALSVRESEQVEWKENVADTEQVAATLSAFANDWANLGGGYVVCGAVEEKDEHGFPRIRVVGLTSSRLKEVEGRVLAACRDRVSPSIAPLTQELPADSPERRVLIFIMPATKSAHMFRRGDDTGRHYVRVGRETREARNGILRELLVRKGVREEWDRSPNPTATVND